MAKTQETWNKKETQKNKEKKRKEKEQKKLERKENKVKSSMDDMIAYVDEFGNITSTPPEARTEVKLEDIELGATKNTSKDDGNSVRKGIVTFFNEQKGYGFIRDMVTQDSIFVHINGLNETIKENNKVTFEVENGKKGLNAFNVTIVR